MGLRTIGDVHIFMDAKIKEAKPTSSGNIPLRNRGGHAPPRTLPFPGNRLHWRKHVPQATYIIKGTENFLQGHFKAARSSQLHHD